MEVDFITAELLVAANFAATALAFKDVTPLEKDLTRHMAYLTVQLQYGMQSQYGVQPQFEITEEPFPLNTSPFPLFPNVHIQATLAMKHLRSITNENIASLGLQKVGRDTRNIFQCC